MDRRHFVAGLAATPLYALLGRAAALAQAAGEMPYGAGVEAFSEQILQAQAQTLARAPFAPPRIALPDALNGLNFEQYQDIRFDSKQAIWASDRLAFRMELFHGGFHYRDPVDIHLVEAGLSQRIPYSVGLFTFGQRVATPPPDTQSSFTGFRLQTPINTPGAFDTFLDFQGATFFRAIASGQRTGIAARGLTLNLAQPDGEEFPIFRAFWIERPRPGAREVVVHALLDSPSVAGAYRFRIQPGRSTVMDVAATLYPRRALTHVGIAPLSSMFLGAPHDMSRQADWRPRVHDSEGLLVWTGMNEWIWRPLVNPDKLQYSAFSDRNPKGFGFMQRERAFDQFQDVDERYFERPCLWVEPTGDWGDGSVDLIELPSREEIHDNLAAFWRPAQPLAENAAYSFSYRLHWCWEPPVAFDGARIVQTRLGAVPRSDRRRFTLDYTGGDACLLCPLGPENVALTASSGEIGGISIRPVPETGGQRLSFEFRPNGTEPSDLRCVLSVNAQHVAETWTYRWTS